MMHGGMELDQFLRALASATVSSETGIAGTHFLVTGSSRWHAVAASAASSTRPVAHALSRC